MFVVKWCSNNVLRTIHPRFSRAFSERDDCAPARPSYEVAQSLVLSCEKLRDCAYLVFSVQAETTKEAVGQSSTSLIKVHPARNSSYLTS